MNTLYVKDDGGFWEGILLLALCVTSRHCVPRGTTVIFSSGENPRGARRVRAGGSLYFPSPEEGGLPPISGTRGPFVVGLLPGVREEHSQVWSRTTATP